MKLGRSSAPFTLAFCLLSASEVLSFKDTGHSGRVLKRQQATFLGGLNLAGFDFGIDNWGNKNGDSQAPPTDQIKHFVDQGAQVIRLPFGWQYMEPNGPGAGIDETFLSTYDGYVQQVLSSGENVYVILDLHNYARYDSKVVGNEVPIEAFSGLWGQLAAKYKDSSRVWFGIMNEPHDLDEDVLTASSTWIQAVQAAVQAIRDAGATSQYILIPGTGYAGAGTFVEKSFDALSSVKDSGDQDLLLYDIHMYLDSDNSGKSKECDLSKDYAKDLFPAITEKLSAAQPVRRAFVSEIGGGSTDSCVDKLGGVLKYVKENPNAWAGFTAWSAGSFNTDYELSITPNADGTDQRIWTEAILPNIQDQPATTQRMMRRLKK